MVVISRGSVNSQIAPVIAWAARLILIILESDRIASRQWDLTFSPQVIPQMVMAIYCGGDSPPASVPTAMAEYMGFGQGLKRELRLLWS